MTANPTDCRPEAGQGSIRLLPAELRDQIAAGEVVERPSSVLKELLENSLDAGADEIIVRLENGGQSFLSVRDNGVGIRAEELALAVTSHATSKIRSFDDLLRVNSFGFRGEALPSIGSVARLRVSSRHRSADEAAFVEVHYGKTRPGGPDALPYGTLVEVRELFSNVPARLKFLKTNATEQKRCQEVVVRAALAREDVTFVLYSGERELCRFMKGEELRARLGKIWPDQLTGGLEPFDLGRPGIRARGLAGLPAQAQPQADRMLFYVNGRTVNDRLLQRAAREAYKGRLLAREYPQLALFLDIDPEEVDVNVHPAKTEVRFRDERAVFGAVLRAVESALAARSPGFMAGGAGFGLSNAGLASPEGSREEEGLLPLSPPRNSALETATDVERRPPGFWGDLDKPGFGGAGFGQPTARPAAPEERFFNADFSQPARESAAAYQGLEPTGSYSENPSGVPLETPLENPLGTPLGAPLALPNGLVYLGQVAGTYLMLLKDDKLLLLDQHAAHERVLMHRFTRESASQSQFLALPLELPLHPAEHEALRAIWEDLAGLGFSLGVSGGMLRVTGLPAVLSRAEARDFLRGAMAGQGDSLRDLLVMMSCKAAIKAGQKLTADEALGLIRQWLDTPECEYCPHGRPAVLALGAAELEKMFKRRG